MNESEAFVNGLYNVTGDTYYREILPEIQKAAVTQLADTFNKKEALNSDDKFKIRTFIEQYIREHQIRCSDTPDKDTLVNRLYKDMVEYSFLTDYLSPEKINEIGLEEINVNSWDCIYLITKEGKVKLPEKFNSPEHARDIVKRILTICGATVDNANPMCLGYLEKNVRSAVITTPVVDDEVGVTCSIRIVNFSNLSREKLLQYETAAAEMLDFLELCLKNGASICIAGATGSGKTGTAGYLLSCVPDETRLLTLEEGSREFNLIRRDAQNDAINDVVHLLTRPSNNKDLHIDQDKLLEMLMRFHPEIIGIGEMRSHEAFSAVEASRTGHTVITTTHAVSAPDTYERIVLLAKKVSTYSEASLYRMAIKAFPIIVYQEQLPNGKRKIMQIIEGLDYREEQLTYNTLFEFQADETEDITQLSGSFQQSGKISNELRRRFRQKGIPASQLNRF